MRTLNNLPKATLETIVAITNSVFDGCKAHTAFTSDTYTVWHSIARGVAISHGVPSENYNEEVLDALTIELSHNDIDGAEAFAEQQLQDRHGDWAGAR